MKFEFATATRIIFGPGTLQEVAPLAAAMGGRAFVVTGSRPVRATQLLEQLKARNITSLTFPVASEPTTELVLEASKRARAADCDLVIAMGGGSVLDTGKAVSALLTNRGDLLDYLEVIGKGLPLAHRSAPFIAIPTTAGSGAEVTRNAVLASPQHRVKVSLRSPLMLPTLAVVDPLLTHSLPPALTASTGLDALTQVLEPYVSHLANPLTDGLCREGLARAGRSLRLAYEDPGETTAREEMALASLLGGLALANAKLGAVHGFAGPIGGMFPAPHGAVCARLLPPVMATNVRALKERTPGNPALVRYNEVGRLLTGKKKAKAADGIAWVQRLVDDLAIPPLSTYGIRKVDFPAVVAKAQKASSMKGNPVALTEAELSGILQAAF